MNILDILIMYRYVFDGEGQTAANEWLMHEARSQGWGKHFVEGIAMCFDSRGRYVRFGGDVGSYEALLVTTIE